MCVCMCVFTLFRCDGKQRFKDYLNSFTIFWLLLCCVIETKLGFGDGQNPQVIVDLQNVNFQRTAFVFLVLWP